MPSAKNYAIRRFVLSTTAWVSVVPPRTCSVVVLENADDTNACAVSTDTDDPTAYKNLPAGAELLLESPVDGAFPPGEPVCFLKAIAGTGPAVVSFIR